MIIVALVILVFLVASLTKLAWDDVITAPWRADLRQKHGDYYFWVRVLECPRCTSVWVAPLPTAAVLAFLVGLGELPIWVAAGSWLPGSFAVAYAAYILILRGEA